MGENSAIEWTDHTFNPWVGCTKVSDGCKNCYAETLMDSRYGRVKWGPQGKRVKTSEANWLKPINWNKKAEAEGRRYRVFCGSLCDVFEGVGKNYDLDHWRSELFNLIDQTPMLDWLLLTKRPEMAFWWRSNKNIWIGTSIENQEMADRRIPELLKKEGAVIKFLSVEPMLGPVDLIRWFSFPFGDKPKSPGIVVNNPWRGVDWVIVGGESGPNRRPFNPDWARSVRDQCKAAGVPFFMKQWDKKRPIPDDLMIREFPKFEVTT